MLTSKIRQTTSCKWCGEPTILLGMKTCDRCCWLSLEVKSDPALVLRMLKDNKNEPGGLSSE